MKKRLGTLFVALAAFVPLYVASPAEAHTDVCVGRFLMDFDGDLGEPGLYAPETTNFWMASPAAVCAGPDLFSAGGTISGNCWVASGSGVTSGGHVFTFTWFGNVMTLDGQVKGVLTVEDNTSEGLADCLGDNAQRVAPTGTLTLSH